VKANNCVIDQSLSSGIDSAREVPGVMIMDRTKALGIVIVGILVASIVVIIVNLPPATQPENGDTGDTTPPVVIITGPSADVVVSGAEAITFSATDENGVPRAEIYIDGVLTAVGQSYNWNTLGIADGPHTIMCRARDPSTNWANQTISVTVNNSIDFSSPEFDPIFKVMAYNVQESGINPDWIEVVKEENADIIMFVETGYWDDDGSADMIAALEELNTYFVDEDPYEAFCTQGISFSTSGEAVFSRYPVLKVIQIQSVTLDDETGYDVTHDFLDAIIDINGTSVHFVGVHLKAAGGEINENRREWENEGIINYFDSLGNVPIVYLGDLNSVSPIDVGPLAPFWDPGVGPMTMLIDPDDPTYGQYSSDVHNFTDVFRTLYPDDPGYTYGHTYTPQTARIDYIITNDFFEDKLINATVGDTAHADTGADHYSLDAFLNWSGGMNMSALAYSPNESPITDLHPSLRIYSPEVIGEKTMSSPTQTETGSSFRMIARESTKVSTLAFVKTIGGLIFRTLL
jgi:endonuclease/exonuclease/phosphatase family metal-dependent hydrolase